MRDRIFTFISRYRRTLYGVAGGTVAGFGYWYFVGCASGTCAITSHPLNSSLYGALLGGLLFNSFATKQTSDNTTKGD